MRRANSASALVFAASALVALGASAWAQSQPGSRWQGYAAAVEAQVRQSAVALDAWARRSYTRRPAVMIGLAGALALPPLALAGLFLYRRRPERIAAGSPEEAGALADEGVGAAVPAWIEIEGDRRVAMPQSRDFIQIGRQDDNDVCIDDESVHRYHAVIERLPQQGFVIVDISGPSGNGIMVNGERRTRSRLADGDTVEVGRSRLRFATAA